MIGPSVVARIRRPLSKHFLRRIKQRVVILSEAKDLLSAGSNCAFGSLPFQTEPLHPCLALRSLSALASKRWNTLASNVGPRSRTAARFVRNAALRKSTCRLRFRMMELPPA